MLIDSPLCGSKVRAGAPQMGVCGVITSSTRLLRSACVRVTAMTFAPQRARARAVALPIPGTQESINTKTDYRVDTHTHTHIPHVLGFVPPTKLLLFHFLTDDTGSGSVQCHQIPPAHSAEFTVISNFIVHNTVSL